MPARMDGGYINEGGQMKTKNGQKYVVNQKPEGIVISKGCAVLLALATIIAVVLVFLVTFFLLTQRCENANHQLPLANNDTLGASLWPSSVTGSRTSAASTMPANSTSTTNTTPSPSPSTSTALLVDLVHLDDIEAEEEIPETSKEMEAVEEIFHHKGWIPIKYSLVLQPLLEEGLTNGTVEILMEADPEERIIHPILLDINQIHVDQVQILRDGKEKLEFIETVRNNGRLLDLELIMDDGEAAKDLKLTVKVKFVSQITSTLQGIYKVDYKDDFGEKDESLVSTQFSPIDARRAFPCIDQPDRKAVFEMTLITPQNKTMVLSNTRAVSSQKEGDHIVTKFGTTPKMSTYLAAFIVSDLVVSNHSTEGEMDEPEIKIWSRREVTDMTYHAYNLTKRVLPLFEEYFDLKYQLPKLDLVGVPDFGYNAMENWGLITFRESALLVPQDKERRSSAAHMERVSYIIAHELAHQWFGNLVTHKWWTDLWLKEGFSTYMSNVALSRLYPEWRRAETFAISEFHAAMSKDSDASSRKIYNPVITTADIRSLFDPITYSKGAILLRMMAGFLGEKAFQAGVRAYLKTFEYANAEQDDLWTLMSDYGHKFDVLPNHLSVKEVMDSWTLQPGYPVVLASKRNSSVVITQKRFQFPKVSEDDEPSSWFIPVTFATSDGKTQTKWLTPDMKELVLEDVLEGNQWLYLNVERMGYYRVNYDYGLTLMLTRHYQEFPEVTRAQIIDDALHLARAQVATYDIPLTFLLRMAGAEKDVLSWMAASKGLEYLDQMMMRESAYDAYKTVMKHILKPAYNAIGFDEKENETHIELTQRAQIVKFACDFGYDRCMNSAQLLYREWMRTPTQNRIKPNMKDIVYCVAMREGGLPEWKFAHKQYLETTSASERETLLTAMGCTQKPWLLSKYLNMTLSSDFGIRKQDGARAFAAVAKNVIGFELAFDFLSTNIEKIAKYYGDGFQTLPKMIESLTTFMSKDYQLEQFGRFAEKAKKLKLAGVEKSIRLATEQVKNNIYWRSHSYYTLQTFLEKLMADFNLNY